MRFLVQRTLVALLLGAAACTDKQIPVAPPSVPQSRFLIVPPSVSGLELPTNDSTPAVTKALPSYTSPIIVEVGVSGLVSMTSDIRTAVQPYNGSMDGSGIMVFGVWNACYVNVTFSWSGQGVIGPSPCLSPPSQRSTWGDTIMVVGDGTVRRGPGVPQYTADCDYSRCHSYSGSQNAWVTPLPATLSLKSADSKVVKGTTVAFTASVSPFSIKNLQVPLKVLSWKWTPSGGSGSTVACSTPVNPCSVAVQEAGSMEVTGLANGAEQTASWAVTLFDPPSACSRSPLTVSHPVTTQFGARDATHPKRHTGRDYGVGSGVPIYAAEGGRVEKGRGETAGIYVVVVTPGVVNSYYFHMQASVVKNGQQVNAGDLLGFVGSTGYSTNPHLHFEQHNPGSGWGADGKVPKANLIQPCTF